jgi:hypothetical protein
MLPRYGTSVNPFLKLLFVMMNIELKRCDCMAYSTSVEQSIVHHYELCRGAASTLPSTCGLEIRLSQRCALRQRPSMFKIANEPAIQ